MRRHDRRSFLTLSAIGGGVVLLSGRPLAALAAGRARAASAAALRPAAAVGSSIAPLFPGVAAGHPGLDVSTADAILALLAYDPTADADAKYYRSQVPIASRIAPLAATQAHPGLSAIPQVTNLSIYYYGLSDRGDHYQYVRYGHSVEPFVTRFHQFEDIVGGWIGAQAIPTTAYTDTAHRNGALSLGILYNPYFGGDASFLQQDGASEFPVGNTLVDLARYFGFDGYFLNVEESLTSDQVALLLRMTASMKRRAARHGPSPFMLQWYDAVTVDGDLTYQNTLNAKNAPFLTEGDCDNLFINYWWGSQEVQDAQAEAAALGLDPFSVAYFGLQLEARTTLGISPTPSQDANNEIDLVIPAHGSAAPVASIALFDPAKGTADLLDFATQSRVAAPPTPGLPALPSAVYQAERLFWSGGTGNPAMPADLGPPHYGIADYIAERSVIGGLPFFSRFNVGTGTAFSVDGRVRSSTAWFSMGIQDVLPTWQWWTRAFDADTTSTDLLSVDYDYTAAFNGGTSLVIAGALNRDNGTDVRLFKTDLRVPPTGGLDVVYRASRLGDPSLHVGLVFADDPGTTVWRKVHAEEGWRSSRPGGDWTRASLELARYAGRSIAAISLGVKLRRAGSPVADYSINIGEIGLYDLRTRVSRLREPRRFRIEQSQASADARSVDLRLAWDLERNVWYYDIFRYSRRRDALWLGRISADAYYVEAMPRIGSETSTLLKLVAVARDPFTERSASLTFSW
jgi:endo-beta-N-acetylglucosaminidase D